MAKIRNYFIDSDTEAICALGRALSSPDRIRILQLIAHDNMIISDISRALKIPQSSVAFHLKILQEAGLIRMEEQPGRHGVSKMCSRVPDFTNIQFVGGYGDMDESYSVEMPVGGYISVDPYPTCGLCAPEGPVGMEDRVYSFYLPERQRAGILWTSRGSVTYRFGTALRVSDTIRSVRFSMELCSEAPGYREDWKSDVTFWVNGVECATWTCPGDYGAFHGRLNPPVWQSGQSQYGDLVVLEVNEKGCFLNRQKASDLTAREVFAETRPFDERCIGNKPDARHVGGFNLFGKTFGNYEQDIVMSIGYHQNALTPDQLLT